jgi:hypothetical protein
MNIKLYTVLLSILLLNISCNESNEQKNDLEKVNLKGSVKSITENTYMAIEKFGEVIKGGRNPNDFFRKENCITKYDINGYLTESNGVIPCKFIYNDKKQLIEENEFTSNTKIFHKYDKNGFEIELNNFHKDTLVQKIKYKNDKMGNKVEINPYNYTGKLQYKIKQIFIGKNLMESKEYDKEGRLTATTKYKYDKNGNQIEETTTDSSNKVFSKNNLKYDENNNLIESKRFFDNALFENENNTTYRFVYNKLDSNKNWTELIEYENEIPVKITERTIEYY